MASIPATFATSELHNPANSLLITRKKVPRFVGTYEIGDWGYDERMKLLSQQRHKREPGFIAARVIFFLTLSLAGVAGAAEIHRWYDSDGKAHFSDVKPLDVETTLVELEPAWTSQANASQAPMIERASRSGGRIDPAGTHEMSLAELIGPCTQARQQFAVLHEQMPVYRTEAGSYRSDWQGDTYRGTRSYLADTDRPATLTAARNRVLEFCSDPDDVRAEVLAYNEWVEAETCQVAMVRLEALEKSGSRVNRSDIEKQRSVIDEQCNRS